MSIEFGVLRELSNSVKNPFLDDKMADFRFKMVGPGG